MPHPYKFNIQITPSPGVQMECSLSCRSRKFENILMGRDDECSTSIFLPIRQKKLPPSLAIHLGISLVVYNSEIWMYIDGRGDHCPPPPLHTHTTFQLIQKLTPHFSPLSRCSLVMSPYQFNSLKISDYIQCHCGESRYTSHLCSIY